MNHRNRKQRTDSLHEDAQPFERTDLRVACENALAARLQCGFELGSNLSLCGLLAWIGRCKSNNCLQCLGKGVRCDDQRGDPFLHHRPLLRDHILDVATDQCTEACFWSSRETSREDCDGAKGASFANDSIFGSLIIAPDLNGGKRNEEPKENA